MSYWQKNSVKQRNKPIEERFWEKVKKTKGCWIWLAGKYSGENKEWGEYGAFNFNGKVKGAHRVSYEFCKGEIKKGLCIDHLCKNTLCVKPDHLEMVTHRENIRRGRNARKEKCKRGHDFDRVVIKKRNGKTYKERRCLKCHAMKQRQYNKKNNTK